MQFMSDADLVNLIKKGNTEKAVKVLYKEFPKIKALILSSGGDKVIARQIFHDSLILLIEKVEKPGFELTSKLSTFLYGINRFLWKNELRRRNKSVELEWKDTLIIEADDINYNEENEERLKHLQKILDSVSEKCKAIFKLFYFEKKSMQVITEKLGYSNVNSAKTQKYKCMEKAIKMASKMSVEC